MSETEAPDGLKCEQCDKVFVQPSRLKRHIALNNCGHIGCNECGAILRSKTSLRYHMESFHGNGGSFPCDECNKAFTSEQVLGLHKD